MSRPLSRLALLLMASSVVALSAKPAAAAWPTSSLAGIPVAQAYNNQTLSSPSQSNVCPDGAGGCYILWFDDRNNVAFGSGSDVYAQHLNSAGVPQWAQDGIAIVGLSGDQYQASILSDGAGGFYACWTNGATSPSHVWLQRFNSLGTGLWAGGGSQLCAAAGGQNAPVMVSDGSTGVIVVWNDLRNSANGQDLYMQRVNSSGVPQWAADGNVLASQTGYQYLTSLVADPTGGAWAVWYEDQNYASTGYDVNANHILPNGRLGWNAADGPGVGYATGNQTGGRAIPDGLGGAYIAWLDDRTAPRQVYMQHMTYSVSASWPANGVALSSTPPGDLRLASDGANGVIAAWGGGLNTIRGNRLNLTGSRLWGATDIVLVPSGAFNGSGDMSMIPDGRGGAIMSWDDYSYGPGSRAHAHRIDANGAALWGASGLIVAGTSFGALGPSIASDGAGGIFVAWQDYRNNTANPDIFAGHVDRTGHLAGQEPSIAAIRDIPNDQGGFVRLSFTGSYLDQPALNRISTYNIYRQVPAAQAQAAIARGAHELAADQDPAAIASHGAAYRIQRLGAQIFYWEYATSVGPHNFDGYSTVLPTVGDSTGFGNPKTAYMVEALDTQSYYYDSLPDSGYSVDNLPPAVPAPLPSQYTPGLAKLHWSHNHEADLAGYRVYRSTSPVFAATASSFVAAVADTGFADVTSQPFYYELTAVDSHGNESPTSSLTPQGVLAIPGDANPALAFAPPSPSPASGVTRLAYALPQAGRVSLALYDATGRRVRVISDGPQDAGSHSLSVALRDEQGHELAAGLYFARLLTGRTSLTQRLVVLGY